jgi:predicted transcriptional regulator
MSERVAADILGLTAQIVSAHVSKNPVATNVLPSLIQSVYRSLSAVIDVDAVPSAPTQTPAVPIKKSVFPDYIVCLEDGKKLKMLKRHLQTSYGLSPNAYRAKWGLPRDYPMVAPKYAATRSGLAKQLGLGRKPATVAPPTGPEASPKLEARKLPARRARGTKT